MGYKMKGFSGFKSSPAKQKYTITWADKDAEKKYKEEIRKEEERKKKDQERINQQIEGTYVETEEDIKRRKEDIERYLPPRKKSPTKQKKNQVRIVGENTSEIKIDKEGRKYVLQDYDTDYGPMRGDTIQLSGDFPRVDNYLMGGDYYGKETKESKKRKKGPKTYKIKTEK